MKNEPEKSNMAQFQIFHFSFRVTQRKSKYLHDVFVDSPGNFSETVEITRTWV